MIMILINGKGEAENRKVGLVLELLVERIVIDDSIGLELILLEEDAKGDVLGLGL